MFGRLISTRGDVAPLVARLVLGVVMFPHGAQHALGWFGGYGFGASVGWMTGTLGYPAPIAAAGIAIEFLAPLALILGVGGRIAGAGLVVFMLVAASTHAANGFFMNWFGSLGAGVEGFEYHLLAIALALVVTVAGSGAFSVDAMLQSRGVRDS